MAGYQMNRKVINEKNCVRRIRFSTTMETTAQSDDSIIVYARLKPLEDSTQETAFEYNDSNIKYREKDKRGNEKLMDFTFHKVFSPSVNQEEMFQSTVDKDMNLFISGENRLLFAYGTTSSGKTYTILGNNQEPGILPRCTVKLFLSLQDLIKASYLCPDQGADLRTLSNEDFKELEDYKELVICLVEDCEGKIPFEVDGFSFEEKDIVGVLDKLYDEVQETNSTYLDDDASYSVWLSYLEVYNENIYDLLSVAKERRPLKIGFDSRKDNYVKGLQHIQVMTWVEMWKMFLYGRSRLHTNETQLNKTSSRSHSVFTIKLVKTKGNKSSVSSLSVCDLAGTERQKKALNKGDSLVESRNINTSLMVLNRCFTVVRENKVTNQSKKPPYRDSKLTLIFQKAFSYGEQITMYVNMSQSPLVLEETKHVLKMSAVAQEMVKQLPKKRDRFLKPNCRFSILCTNPQEPFSGRRELTGYSGVLYLNSNTTCSSQLSDEMIKSYEDRIKLLEEELKSKDNENKGLIETLEDARAEYLNLEKKLEECEKKLSEEEMENEDLDNELTDLQMMFEARCSVLKSTEESLNEANKKLGEEREKVAALEQSMKDLQAELEKSRQQRTVKKGRPLLNAMVHLENTSPNVLSDSTITMNPSAHSTVDFEHQKCKTPRSMRKCKKNLNLFEGL